MSDRETVAETDAVAEQPQELTVEVDGVKHPVSTLTPQVREMIRMHQVWNESLSVKTDDANMARAAVQQIAGQIVDQVREDIAAPNGEAAEDSPAS